NAMGQKLMDALRTFKVDGQLVGRTTGPTVTQYEIEPSPGVKVRQFANLANDLALAMRAASIRVVAPIPGKGAVGVEVPNPSAEIVAFRDMIESKDYQNTPRGHRRSRQDAAPLDRGCHGLGQVGVREHAGDVIDLPAHAQDAAIPDGRSENGRALGVQRASAPAAQGGDGQS